MKAVAARALRDHFPGVRNWHYLDTAATAQKPQAVIDAMMRAGGADYATVHRGVYTRSANMTLAYEAARRRSRRSSAGARTKSSSPAARPRRSIWSRKLAGAQLKAGDRMLLCQLEHHSNIVPWQLAGWQDRRLPADAPTAGSISTPQKRC